MVLLIFIGAMTICMGLGISIAFSLLMSSIALMLYLGVFDVQIITETMYNGADSYPLVAIPFFILAGELMLAGGISGRIVAILRALLGHVRGGLGYAAIVACLVMASLSGSAVADTAAVGAVLLPMMRDAGYKMPRVAALTAAGGIIAPIIPPSIAFIVFGVTANVSITDMFIAGVAPGLLMALVLTATWAILVRRGEGGDVLPKPSFNIVVGVLVDGFWALLMPVIIIGGLRLGIFTPTEASVVATFYCLFVGLVVYRKLNWANIQEAIVNSAKLSAAIMFLVAAAATIGWVVTIADLPFLVADLLAPLVGSPTFLMFAIVLILLVVGTVMDFIPTVLILTPILLPLIKIANIDPVYFGVIFVLTNAIGLLTPPVGIVLSVACRVANVPEGKGAIAVMPFLVALVLLVVLFVVFPSLVMTPFHWIK